MGDKSAFEASLFGGLSSFASGFFTASTARRPVINSHTFFSFCFGAAAFTVRFFLDTPFLSLTTPDLDFVQVTFAHRERAAKAVAEKGRVEKEEGRIDGV